jgi:hypothetical protein
MHRRVLTPHTQPTARILSPYSSSKPENPPRYPHRNSVLKGKLVLQLASVDDVSQPSAGVDVPELF